jgi:hypothetical protein
MESDRIDSFDFDKRRPFWPGTGGTEVVKDKCDCSLLAAFSKGCIRLGVVDWAVPDPIVKFVTLDDLLLFTE